MFKSSFKVQIECAYMNQTKLWLQINILSSTNKQLYQYYLIPNRRWLIRELRVDVLNGYSGFLSDNKACYHRLTGYNALLEITRSLSIWFWRAQVSYNRQILFNTAQYNHL